MAFTQRSERALMALAAVYAVGDIIGSEGLVYNLALAVYGVVALRVKDVGMMRHTFYCCFVACLLDVIFLASEVGGGGQANVKAVGSFLVLLKVAAAYCLLYAIRNDFGASIDPRSSAAPGGSGLEAGPTAVMMHGAEGGDEEATKVAASPYSASPDRVGGYQGGYQNA